MNLSFNITVVERETGLSKDVLRVWERRYGFPKPGRDAHGDRIYVASEVERLKWIKRLMDQGHRPGRLMALSDAELGALSAQRPATVAKVVPGADAHAGAAGEADASPWTEWIERLRQHDGPAFQQALQQALVKQGLSRFVQDTVVPLTEAVGLAWERGELAVFEEHLYTELVSRVLRQALSGLPLGRSPRILLTSLPDEPHGLGLLMVEALWAVEGAACIALGTQTPLLDVVAAAQAHRADVVALSFSVAFPARQIPVLVGRLRERLPEPIALWVGGAGVRRVRLPEGVRAMTSLEDGLQALADWSKSVEGTS